jgi:hypothetical protein
MAEQWPFKPLVERSSRSTLINPQIWGLFNFLPNIWRAPFGTSWFYLEKSSFYLPEIYLIPSVLDIAINKLVKASQLE